MAGPLNGLQVLDLTTVLMGPYTTQVLADMGASVIKVESPEGDPVRGIGPARTAGMGALFLQANRGKRSIVLDLKAEEGRSAFLDLARRSDVVVTSVRPAALARLGLGYDELKAVKPDIIFAALTGYGQAGPYAARPAYDDLIQGASGLPDLYVTAGGMSPRYVPFAVADRFVGAWAVGAVLAALWHRERTGRGQSVEIPMFETMTQVVLGDHLGGMLYDPPIGPAGYPRLLSHDRRPYPTKDGYVCALIYNDGQWRRFLEAVDRRELFETDPRFASITARTENIDAIYAMVAGILGELTTAECVRLLEAIDVPVLPLNTLDSLINDPHLVASGFFQEVEHPTEGRLRMPSPPTRFSDGEAPLGDAPRFGQHSREILTELGYDPDKVSAVLAAGIKARPADRS